MTKHLFALLPYLSFLPSLCGCVANESEDTGSDNNDDDAVATADPSDPSDCTDPSACLFEGKNSFTVDGSSRDVLVRLPNQPVGAPVVFVWHYLNGTASQMLAWMGTEDLLAAGYVVVAPESRGLSYTEWLVEGSPQDNPDVALFDALTATLRSQYDSDPTRLYATGFSAGGLFTSYLTMHRGDVLAATAPFSGGVPSYLYSTPEGDVSVMLTWGGDGDTYGGFDFGDASMDFADDLQGDGHAVILCTHELGHSLPPGAQANVVAYFNDHGGADETPWSNDSEAIPTGCVDASR
jgi:dienelactone hydrolase